MWEIKKVNFWDHNPKPWTVWNNDPLYTWCLFDPNGNLKVESWGFAIHDKSGKIVQGSDYNAVNSLLTSVPTGEDVKLYGPFESLKDGNWNRSTPIDVDGCYTQVIKPEMWLR